MNNAPFTASLLATTLLLAGCGADQTQQTAAPASPPAPAPAAAAPPADQTEAVYGDEAPVTIDAPKQDDHGHAHNEDSDHAHDDEHEHNADGTHPDEEPAHDHGDGSEPHDH